MGKREETVRRSNQVTFPLVLAQSLLLLLTHEYRILLRRIQNTFDTNTKYFWHKYNQGGAATGISRVSRPQPLPPDIRTDASAGSPHQNPHKDHQPLKTNNSKEKLVLTNTDRHNRPNTKSTKKLYQNARWDLISLIVILMISKDHQQSSNKFTPEPTKDHQLLTIRSAILNQNFCCTTKDNHKQPDRGIRTTKIKIYIFRNIIYLFKPTLLLHKQRLPQTIVH